MIEIRPAVSDNPYGVSERWGIIGTHIRPDAGRQGLGRRLFAVTLDAASTAGLEYIDATIGADNAAGLAYYRTMGFAPYRDEVDGAVPHRMDVRQRASGRTASA